MKLAIFFAIMVGIVSGEEHENPKPEGLVEVTASRNFNYGLLFVPIAKGVALDTQFYWTSEGGSQLLTGATYVWKPHLAHGLKIIPGLYYVAEGCERQTKPWGCHDAAVGLGWEWENREWGARGFVAQTLRKTELRFGLADPVQVFRRSKSGKWEYGLAFAGENTEHHLFGKGGLSGRRYFGSGYAEVTFLSGHHGPEARFTVGRSF